MTAAAPSMRGRRAWLRALLHLAPLAAALPAQAQAQATTTPAPLRMGMNTLWMPGDAKVLRERFRRVRALGMTDVRLDWEWRQVEIRRGYYVWDKLDLLVKIAHEEGISLLPIVHYAPAWALRREAKPDDVYELALREDTFVDYANFLLACVRRYGPGGNVPVPSKPIVHWEVWNEPNIKQFWGPKPDPAAFTRLMKQVAATMAPVRSSIKLVHAGLAKCDIEFMWQLWDANPAHGDTFDIMSLHPYVFDWKDGIREPDAIDRDERATAEMGFVGSVKDGGYLPKVFNVQLFMTLKGAPNKPIWITEMGYFVANHRLGVSEHGQGERLQATVAYIKDRLTHKPFGTGKRALAANVQRLYWFSLDDYPSPDGLGSFGVYRPDGSLRPAGEALRALTR